MHQAALSDDELRAFEREGMLGPFDLLSPERAESLAQIIVDRAACVPGLLSLPARTRNQERVDDFLSRLTHIPSEWVGTGYRFSWAKSAHAHVPEILWLATRSAICNRVAALLGHQVLLWGAQVIQRKPGQVHRWHCDVEHLAWPGITVWLGMRNIAQASSLRYIPGSHQFPTSPNDQIPKGLDATDDAAVLEVARRYVKTSTIVPTTVRPGQFLIFAGRLWHGSRNLLDQERTALIFQYTHPESKVRIPCTFEPPIQWHPFRPPCVIVRGTGIR